MKITDILTLELVVPNLEGQSKIDVLRELSSAVAAKHREISAEDLTAITNTLQSTTFRAFEFYFAATLIYLMMALGFRLLLDAVGWFMFERRYA